MVGRAHAWVNRPRKASEHFPPPFERRSSLPLLLTTPNKYPMYKREEKKKKRKSRPCCLGCSLHSMRVCVCARVAKSRSEMTTRSSSERCGVNWTCAKNLWGRIACQYVETNRDPMFPLTDKRDFLNASLLFTFHSSPFAHCEKKKEGITTSGKKNDFKTVCWHRITCVTNTNNKHEQQQQQRKHEPQSSRGRSAIPSHPM